jgi:hypothetical protein
VTKLNGISDGAKNVSALRGVLFDGSTIPLPVGFTEAQCAWIVSPNLYSPSIIDIDENGVRAGFMVQCSTVGRVLTCKWWQREQFANPNFQSYGGFANYLIIGVK